MRSVGPGLSRSGLEHRSKKSTNAEDHLSFSLRGGHRLGNRLGSDMSISMKGGLHSAISHAVAPRLHTSTLSALYEPERISGACVETTVRATSKTPTDVMHTCQ